MTDAVTLVAETSLTRSELTAPGIRRRRSGRGFRYFTPDGKPLADQAALARIKALVIPPAWEDVWICPADDGHIQALGTDVAGRRQYRYHDHWREERDAAKFDRVLEFGRALPRVRKMAEQHLRDGHDLGRDRVLAAAVRLIDLGFFRSGGDEYASDHGTYGLATLLRKHVTCSNGELIFKYVGKSSKEHLQTLDDELVYPLVRSLRRRRTGSCEDLFVFRSGPRWHNVTAGDINDYLRDVSGGDFTAKDFRTWHATVLAAVGLSVSLGAETDTARKRAVSRVVHEVADYLGNTPAVCRASYIDPRIITRYEEGVTIASMLTDLGQGQEFGDVATKGAAEEAVLKLLGTGSVSAADDSR